MGDSLGYDVQGAADAPVLVLAPSLGTHPDMWSPQTPLFAEQFRVVRVELRGHCGDSPLGPYTIASIASDMLATLDAMGISQFSFCGLSLGGMAGMWLAAHVPSRVERLALCCTSAYMPPAQGWLDRAATVRRSGMSVIADAVVGRWFTADFAAQSPEVVAWARDMLLATPAEGYAGCCEAIAAMDLRPILEAITAPTLVLAGALDPSAPPSHAQVIVGAIAEAQLVVVPSVSHLATAQEPDVCAQLLLDHLGGTS
jgi:3-oxoadipate enol-lactonase